MSDTPRDSDAGVPARNFLIYGFGGHARSVADIVLANGANELVFVDDNARAGETFFRHRVVPSWNEPLTEGWQVFSAAGDAVARSRHVEQFQVNGWALNALIARSATVGVGANIKDGCFVAHHAHVGPMASLGLACIVNTGAIVEHECSIGDFTHVSVNSTVAGRTKIGNFCMIGAGATVIDGLEIADHVVIGAGAMVHKSIFEPGTYVGNPARRASR